MNAIIPNPEKCLVCGHPVATALDLGEQPLANALLNAQTDFYNKHKLGLAFCRNCTHGQLTNFVNPEVLFDNYLYASGTSNTLKSYFEWFSEMAHQRLEGRSVLELASNDGSLLDSLRNRGFTTTGVDPAKNLCQIAESKGHTVFNGYFPTVSPNQRFDFIVAMNVFAHNPEPRMFLEGIKNCLVTDGIAAIQTSQGFMLDRGEFDTIYHEHYSFFTPRSIAYLANQVGLRLIKTEIVSVHGGSPIYYLSHENETPNWKPQLLPCSTFLVDNPDLLPLSDEDKRGPEDVYRKFAEEASERIGSVRNIIREARSDGFKIALVGVAAKAMTFLNAAGIEFDYYFDEAELKRGKFVPGAAMPIANFSEVSDLSERVMFVIGAWNFANEIERKIREFSSAPELRFLTYFPEICWR